MKSLPKAIGRQKLMTGGWLCMYRFFASPEQITGEEIVITGEDVNHMKNVLRMKPGEKVRISAGSSEDYFCSIVSLEDREVILHIDGKEESSIELPVQITLFQGLPKGDKMELIIQKAVELGVHEIVPVSMKRCVVKLDAKKAAAKVKRWNAIAESAAKQSGRMVIPEVMMPMTCKEVLQKGGDLQCRLLPYENAEGMEGIRRILEELTGQVKERSEKTPLHVGIFIGPEGGFDEAEVEQAREAGWETVSLGRRILRTETAGMAMLAMLVYALEP